MCRHDHGSKSTAAHQWGLWATPHRHLPKTSNKQHMVFFVCFLGQVNDKQNIYCIHQVNKIKIALLTGFYRHSLPREPCIGRIMEKCIPPTPSVTVAYQHQSVFPALNCFLNSFPIYFKVIIFYGARKP